MPLPDDAQEDRLVRQISAVAPSGAPVAPDPAATASPRAMRAKQKKKKKGGYADMMAEAMQRRDLTDAERAAEAQARLAAKLVAPDKIVKGNRGLDRI